MDSIIVERIAIAVAATVPPSVMVIHRAGSLASLLSGRSAVAGSRPRSVVTELPPLPQVSLVQVLQLRLAKVDELSAIF